ncbi:MAG: SoxR reducing system RseC family protein, partial [Bacteroidales bacterium]|nr:SoxR reducing system RseC family protein [Bacteroidales bacterium]
MSQKDEIVHTGRVVEMTPDFTTVEIIVSSACSSCHAKGLCGMSEDEQKLLQIEYENTFDLKEIEEYATKTLGMVRLEDSQIVVLEQTAEDKAEILREERGEAFSAVLQEAGSLWTAI